MNDVHYPTALTMQSARDSVEAPQGPMQLARTTNALDCTFRHMAMVLCGLALVLTGCRDDAVMLSITSYNYTDRYIDRFSVGGVGGGNVYPSTHEAGGGKTACCMVYDPDHPLPITLTVKWMFGYQRGPDGKITVPDEHHETTAVLDGPVPEDPAYLEVHFMPDGTVQLRMTSEPSLPLLQIDRSNITTSNGNG